MALALRRVTGIYKDANGVVLASKKLSVVSMFVFGDDGILVPNEAVNVITDAAGVYDFNLYTSDVPDAYVRYIVRLHNGKPKKFDLPAGADTSLDELINAYDGAQAASSAVIILDHEERITELEESGVGGGGSIPFLNEAGASANISLAGGNTIPFINEGGSAANIPLA